MAGDKLYVKVGGRVQGPLSIREIRAIASKNWNELCLVSHSEHFGWMTLKRYLRDTASSGRKTHARTSNRPSTSARVALDTMSVTVSRSMRSSTVRAHCSRAKRRNGHGFHRMAMAVLGFVAIVGVLGLVYWGIFGRVTDRDVAGHISRVGDGALSTAFLGTSYLGRKDAPVHVVKFADFASPDASKEQSESKAMLIFFGKRIRYTFHPLVSSTLPGSVSLDSALALHCATFQHKRYLARRWIYRLIAGGKTLDTRRLALHLRLNTESFRSCMESDRSRETVLSLSRLANTAGIAGASFFVNGSLVGEPPPGVRGSLLLASVQAHLPQSQPPFR